MKKRGEDNNISRRFARRKNFTRSFTDGGVEDIKAMIVMLYNVLNVSCGCVGGCCCCCSSNGYKVKLCFFVFFCFFEKNKIEMCQNKGPKKKEKKSYKKIFKFFFTCVNWILKIYL